MPYQDPEIVVASAARNANGNSGLLNPGEMGETINLLVNVTAITGAGATLALAVEWSNDGTVFATPETADTFANITTAVAKVKAFERKAAFYRIVWTITGTTPSITFAVSEYLTN